VRWALVKLYPLAPLRFLRKYLPDYLETVRYCRRHGIPHVSFREMNTDQTAERLRGLNLDAILNVGTPRRIEMRIARAAKLAVNFHAGKLPEYRGAHTAVWAILNGEPSVTVTAHEIAEEIDAGRIILEEEVPVDPEKIMSGEFNAMLFRQYVRMAGRILEDLSKGVVRTRPQERPEKARWYPWPRPEDFTIYRNDGEERKKRIVLAARVFGTRPTCSPEERSGAK
jgi:methionyl-tRNA formyltransferase